MTNKPLTAAERAEKIWMLFKHGEDNLIHDSLISLIAAQIQEAENESADRNYKEPDQARWWRHGYAEGFRIAKEKAAGIAYDYDHDCAERIRAMEDDNG